jgi:hypothetical protein
VRIVFTRSGGWPPPLRCELDAEVLTDDERAGAEALLAWTPAPSEATGGPADGFQYDLVVIGGAGDHHVRMHEGEARRDPRVRALLDRLEREAPPPW